MWLVYGETKLQLTLSWYRKCDDGTEIEWEYFCDGRVLISNNVGEGCLQLTFDEGVVVDIVCAQPQSQQAGFHFIAPEEVRLYQHEEAEERGIAIPRISNS